MPVDSALLEQHKENIQPLATGRAASKLANYAHAHSAPHYKELLQKQRLVHENNVQSREELDDPLQAYLDYIAWIQDSYPAGNSAESGLVGVLERCTSCFRDTSYYKNDPRYLRVWLEYAKFSDAPREIFVYLAHKDIGLQLALYYEEFACFLEGSGNASDAREIYEMGIEARARPQARLQRAFSHFQRRSESSSGGSPSVIRNALSVKRVEPTAPTGLLKTEHSHKRPKLQVYADEVVPTLKQTLFAGSRAKDLGSIGSRTKENVISATPWAGEVIRQQGESERPHKARFEVYRDEKAAENDEFELYCDENGLTHTIIRQQGKKTERVCANFALIYSEGEECCFEEIMAMNWSKKAKNGATNQLKSDENEPGFAANGPQRPKRARNGGLLQNTPSHQVFTVPLKDDSFVLQNDTFTPLKSNKFANNVKGENRAFLEENGPLLAEEEDAFEKEHSSSLKDTSSFLKETSPPLKDSSFLKDKILNKTSSFLKDDTFTPKRINSTPLKDHTFTIPLNDDTEAVQRPSSPTMTMFSREAASEVYGMFNQAAHNLGSDEEDEKLAENTTNYDGFVTETLSMVPATTETATPPTDHYDSDDQAASLPFIEEPHFDPNEAPELVNPADEEVRNRLLDTLNVPLSTYKGYHGFRQTHIGKMALFEALTNPKTKSISKGSAGAIINYCGDQIYCLRHEVGRGGYGVVYLVETELGDLKALKAEKPASRWEFYVLRSVHSRVQEPRVRQLVVNPDLLSCFQDESFLVMPFVAQGTVLDVVNYYHNRGQSVDEVVGVFLAVELLRAVEGLHKAGIIHGDLKADNCMMRLEAVEKWSSEYCANGSGGWAQKGITLIDFGRAADTSLFGPNTRFVSHWKLDMQDCPEMQKGQPWTYEADYYGIAAVLHTVLFGNFIETKVTPSGYALLHSLKRYWQQELWGPLFDTLLNPYSENCVRSPKVRELRAHREKLACWLIESGLRLLKPALADIEAEMNASSRRLLGLR